MRPMSIRSVPNARVQSPSEDPSVRPHSPLLNSAANNMASSQVCAPKQSAFFSKIAPVEQSLTVPSPPTAARIPCPVAEAANSRACPGLFVKNTLSGSIRLGHCSANRFHALSPAPPCPAGLTKYRMLSALFISDADNRAARGATCQACRAPNWYCTAVGRACRHWRCDEESTGRICDSLYLYKS